MDKVWNDFVKLCMDRVYKGGVEGVVCDILKSFVVIDSNAFSASTNWIVLYVKYVVGWWNVFEFNGGF